MKKLKIALILYTLTVSFISGYSQFSKSITVSSPGTLGYQLTDYEQHNVKNLTVSGKIDARDFQFLRDSLPALEELDLSKSTIVAFSGKATYWESINYSANSFPANAFYNSTTNLGKSSLKSIFLPDSLRSIESQSFQSCSNLVSVSLPSKLTTISSAFVNCTNLTKIEVPSTVTTLSGSFSGCTKLSAFNIPVGVKFIEQGTFKNCTSLK